MPYKSAAQRGWAHSPAGIKALGGQAKVREWDKASKGLHLPKRAGKASGGLVAQGNPLVQGPSPARQPRVLSDRVKTSKVIRQMSRDRKRRHQGK